MFDGHDDLGSNALGDVAPEVACQREQAEPTVSSEIDTFVFDCSKLTSIPKEEVQWVHDDLYQWRNFAARAVSKDDAYYELGGQWMEQQYNDQRTEHAAKVTKLKEKHEFKGKPLVDPPEFDEAVRDTDKQPYWIPGAFPTIFQNEIGDPYNVVLEDVYREAWGPHILRGKGWVGQSHQTLMFWWINMNIDENCEREEVVCARQS